MKTLVDRAEAPFADEAIHSKLAIKEVPGKAKGIGEGHTQTISACTSLRKKGFDSYM